MYPKIKSFSKIIFNYKVPLVSLISLSVICIVSYLLAGWMMKPIGDDYVWLHAFHHSPNWIHSLYTFVTTQNGRYMQNIFVAVPYGLFGMRFLKVVSFITILLFLTTTYFAIRAYESTLRNRLGFNKYKIIALAIILFFIYTSLSVSYEYVNGGVDNSFQNILYYPGVVTYTFPFLFFGLFLSTLTLYRHKIFSIRSHFVIGTVAFLIGLFGETTPVLYVTIMFGILIPYFYFVSRHILRYTKILISIALGFIASVITIYFSPAGVYRRSIVAKQDSLSLFDVISSSLTSLHNQYLLVFGSTSTVTLGVGLAIISGWCIHMYAVRYIKKYQFKARELLLFSILSLILWAASIVISAALYTIGYHAMGALTPPRFEILFNIWLALSLISFGMLLSTISQFIISRHTTVEVSTYIVMILLLILVTPHTLTIQTNRVMDIATFSRNWTQQDNYLHDSSQSHLNSVYVPVIDIGDGFSITCSSEGKIDWLAVAKQTYYNIPHVCSVK